MAAPKKTEQTERQVFQVFVPGKPVSVNRMYVTGRGRNRNGRRRSDEAIAWETAICYACRRFRPGKGMVLHTPLRVDIELYRLRANADPDNYVKAVLDGLKLGLGVDDKHYSPVRVCRVYWVPQLTPGARITVWESVS